MALARALVNRPRALLLDEPLGALDLRLRKQLQIELKRIQQDIGITFVHVTHDQEEAMSMADTIAVMNGGKIEQAGSRDRPLRAPADRLRGQLPRHLEPRRRHVQAVNNGHTKVETHDGAELHVPSERCGPHGTDDVRVGVRPEKITLVPAGEAVPDGSNVLHGQGRRRRLPRRLDPVRDPGRRRRGAQRLHAEHRRLGARLARRRAATCSWPGSPEHTFVVARG